MSSVLLVQKLRERWTLKKAAEDLGPGGGSSELTDAELVRPSAGSEGGPDVEPSQVEVPRLLGGF